MRSGLGGHETLNLYAEAITKMPENPGIPPLFRDIFKNAYLTLSRSGDTTCISEDN
jgi:type I restriction enzyme M protein